MILRQDQPSRYAGLQCASRKLSPRNLPRERFSSLTRSRPPTVARLNHTRVILTRRDTPIRRYFYGEVILAIRITLKSSGDGIWHRSWSSNLRRS